MPVTADELKLAIRQILGDVASQIFLARMDKTFDEAGSDKAALAAACLRVEKMANLFIGAEESKVIAKRCREILEKA